MLIDAVASEREAEPSWIGFFRAIGTYGSHIGGGAALGHLVGVDEVYDGVGAGWHVAVWSESLCQAAKFFRVGFYPLGAVAEFAQFLVFGDFAGVGVDGSAVECPMSDHCTFRVDVTSQLGWRLRWRIRRDDWVGDVDAVLVEGAVLWVSLVPRRRCYVRCRLVAAQHLSLCAFSETCAW